MSEIKDRQDAASDIDPIVAALADDKSAVEAVEGISEAAEPVEATAEPVAGPTDAEPAANEAPTPVEAADPVEVAAAIAEDLSEAEDVVVAADDALGDEAAPAELVAVIDEAAGGEAALAADWSDDALLEYVADAIAPAPLDHLIAAHSDTVVELEDQVYGADTDEDADDEGPLLDGDLEHGIASVFAALHAARADNARADETIEPLGDLEAAEGVTFRLLGELDRLWHRAA